MRWVHVFNRIKCQWTWISVAKGVKIAAFTGAIACVGTILPIGTLPPALVSPPGALVPWLSPPGFPMPWGPSGGPAVYPPSDVPSDLTSDYPSGSAFGNMPAMPPTLARSGADVPRGHSPKHSTNNAAQTPFTSPPGFVVVQDVPNAPVPEPSTLLLLFGSLGLLWLWKEIRA